MPTQPSAAELRIRGFRPTDAERVRELTIEGFDGVSIDQAADQRLGPGPHPGWTARKWAGTCACLEAHPENHFVAELEGEVVGYVTTEIKAVTRVGGILDLAVDARFRRRGIGARLIEHALAHFGAKGMTLSKIATLEQNQAARSLYPEHGFVEVARQIHYARRLEDRSDAPEAEAGPPAGTVLA